MVKFSIYLNRRVFVMPAHSPIYRILLQNEAMVLIIASPGSGGILSDRADSPFFILLMAALTSLRRIGQ